MIRPLCFKIKADKLSTRFDVKYYHSPIVDSFKQICSKYRVKLKPLGDYIIKAKRYPSFYGIPYLPEGTICFKGEAIDRNGFIINKNLSYIPKAINKQFPETILKEGDLVFSVRGTIGKIFVVSKKYIGSNISSNLIRIKLNKVNPYFIKYFLMSKYGKAEIEQVSSGSLQYTITVEDIESIKIPEKGKTKQDKIVKRVSEIEKQKIECSNKYEKSIEKLKEYLKDNINIKKDNMFIVKSKEIQDRIDCLSLSYELKKIYEELDKLTKEYDLLKGKDLNIVKRINQKKYKEIRTKEIKYIEVKHTSKQPNYINGYIEDVLIALPSRARQIIKENDILLPRPIGSIEKIAIVSKEYEGHICSTGFIIIRPKNFDEACLLTSILKSKIVQRQLILLQSGSIQPEISPTDFKKIILPVPKEEKDKNRIIARFKNEIKEARKQRNNYHKKRKEVEKTFIDELFC